MKATIRNNVKVLGEGPKTMVLLHGYGCDQGMWRLLIPAFQSQFRIVLMDLVGFGGSAIAAYERAKYRTLHGHAGDLIEVMEELSLEDAVVVGHSVSAMIAALAAIRAPSRFGSLVMVAPSPCYINDGDYVGGFDARDIDGLLEFLDANFIGWSHYMAPKVMGAPDRADLSHELTESFCRTDPEIAKHFGRVTFLADHRADMPLVPVRTLILQCSEDLVAPTAVGEWLDRTLPDSELARLRATGHCPHLSAPDETIAAIRAFLC